MGSLPHDARLLCFPPLPPTQVEHNSIEGTIPAEYGRMGAMVRRSAAGQQPPVCSQYLCFASMLLPRCAEPIPLLPP